MTITPHILHMHINHPIEIIKKDLAPKKKYNSIDPEKKTLIIATASALFSPIRVFARDPKAFPNLKIFINNSQLTFKNRIQNHKEFLASCCTKKSPTFLMVSLETGVSLTAINMYESKYKGSSNIQTKANIFGYLLGSFVGALICPFTQNNPNKSSQLPEHFTKKFAVAFLRNSLSVPALTYQFSEDPTKNNLCGATLYVASRCIDLWGNIKIKTKKYPSISNPMVQGQLTTCLSFSFLYSFCVRTSADIITKYSPQK